MCHDNKFLENDFYKNTFGNDFYKNTFEGRCVDNIFGNDCHSNTFGDNFSNNTLGNGFTRNTFGTDCKYNTFGNYCEFNTFGTDCSFNTFGNDCNSNKFKIDGKNLDSVKNVNFDNGCSGNTILIDNNVGLLKNYNINKGVNNKNITVKFTDSDIEVNVWVASSGEVIQEYINDYMTDSDIDEIWNTYFNEKI
jgi:hypothetical protein